MKSTLKVLSVVIKVLTVIFAVIGAIMTVAMVILAKPSVYHVYDVVEECENLDPDDETQDIELMSEAFGRTMADPRVKGSRFIHAVAYGVGKFTSFVANL